MKAVFNSLKIMMFLIVFFAAGAIVVVYYPWLFGKNVDGEIIEVERVTMPNTMIGNVNKFQMHSYAVLIQDKNGDMFTSSSEDRRWEVAKKGMCVIALFYRHPPWRLQSAGAFYNARVQKIYRCPGKDYSSDAHLQSEKEKQEEVPSDSEPTNIESTETL
jgi:hypothetical protein